MENQIELLWKQNEQVVHVFDTNAEVIKAENRFSVAFVSGYKWNAIPFMLFGYKCQTNF